MTSGSRADSASSSIVRTLVLPKAVFIDTLRYENENDNENETLRYDTLRYENDNESM